MLTGNVMGVRVTMEIVGMTVLTVVKVRMTWTIGQLDNWTMVTVHNSDNCYGGDDRECIQW